MIYIPVLEYIFHFFIIQSFREKISLDKALFLIVLFTLFYISLT